MGSTATLFGMLEKTAQKDLRGSLVKQQQLEQQEKVLDSNIERAHKTILQPPEKEPETQAEIDKRNFELRNSFSQQTLSIQSKQSQMWKRGEINTEVERKWQMLRQQHHRTQIMQAKEQQLREQKEQRTDRLETEESYSHPSNKGFGG